MVVPDVRYCRVDQLSETLYAHGGSIEMPCAKPPVFVPLCGPPFPPRKKKFGPGRKLPRGIGGAPCTVPPLFEIARLKLFRWG